MYVERIRLDRPDDDPFFFGGVGRRRRSLADPLDPVRSGQGRLP